MTAVSKNVYFDVLDMLINTITQFTKLLKWNLLVLWAIFMPNTMKILIKKDLKFKAGDHVRISKYKNIFAKGLLQIGQKKFLLLVKLKIQFLGHT